ncbi:MAG: hypothetical protein RL060_1180, partial [Bacteroidota bacterium]
MSTIEVTKIATYSGHKDCIYSIVQGINPAHFFTADGEGMVVIWDLQKPNQGEVFAQVPHSIYALCVDVKTNTLLIGENTMGIHLINISNHQQTKSLKITDGNIFDIITTEHAIMVACGDGKVIVLDKIHHTIQQTIHASDKSARCLAIKGNTLMVGY